MTKVKVENDFDSNEYTWLLHCTCQVDLVFLKRFNKGQQGFASYDSQTSDGFTVGRK